MKKLFAIFFIFVSFFSVAGTQTPLEGQLRDEALTRILSGYDDWTSVALSGKIQIPNLPLGIKPSVKIWMKRGESMMISLRAPVMGEIGRAELSADSLLLVNKMKNYYCKEALADVLRSVPATLDDLQSLVLARVALLGSGQLTQADDSAVSLMAAADGSYMLVPVDARQPQGGEYGYLVRPDGKIQALIVSIAGKKEPVTVIYDYTISGGYELLATVPGGALKEITFSLDRPTWGAAPFAPFRPDSKFKRLSFAQFFKSF